MAHFRVNTNDFKAGIRKLLDAQKKQARQAMLDVARELEKGAKARAPIDEGLLVKYSIASQVVEYKKSFAAVVYVPVNSPASDYAIPMHEHTYSLGAKSQAKQSDVKCVVGRRYLSRAVEEQKPRLAAVVAGRLGL